MGWDRELVDWTVGSSLLLTSAGMVPFLSILNLRVQDTSLLELIGGCHWSKWWSLIYFNCPALYKEKTPDVHRTDVPSLCGHCGNCPCGPESRPLHPMLTPFLFSGECHGTCVDNSYCSQPCPPDTPGDMGFLCRQKKWHKVIESCRTLTAFNIFEVISFLSLAKWSPRLAVQHNWQ